MKLELLTFGDKGVSVLKWSFLRPDILQYAQNSNWVQKPISCNGMLII